jgi:hypothetical protein
MSLYSQLRGLVVVPSHRQPAKVIVGPSDEEVKSRFERFVPILSDGPVPVHGVRIGWKRTTAGPLGAIFANPVTNRRELWALDLHTHKPRHLAVLQS